MRPSPSAHAHFFSSLKQVEKRLRLDNTSESSPRPSQPLPLQKINYTSTESLSTPIYLNSDQPTPNCSTLQDGEPPHQFLSNSPDFPSTHEDPPQSQNPECDHVQLLMQLLGLSDSQEQEEEEKQRVCLGLKCGCDDGFYGKIVGVKGPKCGREVERLDAWIHHFLKNKTVIEPFRLAHLLLGKAAFVSGDSSEIHIPSTIDDFLGKDPPTN